MDNTLKLVLYLAALLAIVFLSGCPGPVKPDDQGVIVKGMSDITSASAALESHKAGVKALSTGGNLKYIYYKDGKTKEENLNLNLRFDPPRRLYFGAQTGVGEVIRLGSNDEEFWFRAKPKEISQYLWGTWKQLDKCSTNLLFSPESFLDALGMVIVDPSWQLENTKGQDVLVKYGDNRQLEKKLFINPKGYLVSRIEYYDKNAFLMATVDMDDYRTVDDSSPVPAKIDITAYKDSKVESKIKITLKNLKYLKPEKIGPKTFKRPDSKGFSPVFKMDDNCKFVEQ